MQDKKMKDMFILIYDNINLNTHFLKYSNSINF